MVAKISSGKSLFGALSYNQQKVDRGVASVIFSQNIIRTVDGSFNIPLCMRSFEPYLAANHKTENPVFHVSLNPHPGDVLSDGQLCDIAQEYMQKLGYGSQPYLVYKHEDTGRAHLHIVSVRVGESGAKIRDSYQKRRSQRITRWLEKKYNLIPAEKKDYGQELPLKPVDIRAGNVKKQVSGIVKSLMEDYHFQSIHQYRALLNIYGLTVEEVKGEARGKPYNGLVYCALDKKGEKIGNPFRASLIGKSAGYDALQKKIGFSKEALEDKKAYARTKKIVSSLLKENPSRKQFEKELAQNGISVVFKQSDDKRIYGVTFIDHQQKAVFNGSNLGKEFSANAFHERFSGIGTGWRQQAGVNTCSYTNHTPEQEPAIEATAGISLLEQHGDNYQELAFDRRIRRKKKKRKGPRL